MTIVSQNFIWVCNGYEIEVRIKIWLNDLNLLPLITTDLTITKYILQNI